MSRNQLRADCLRQAMEDVNMRNMQQVGRSHFRGMKRKERRALARAWAWKYFHDRRVAG